MPDHPNDPRSDTTPFSWVSWEIRPGIRLVALAGELDIHTAPLLADVLRQPENAVATHLVINVARVDFLAAAGVNALVAAAGRRRPGHTHLVGAVSNPALTRPIEITGAAESITVHLDVDQCLRFIEGH